MFSFKKTTCCPVFFALSTTRLCRETWPGSHFQKRYWSQNYFVIRLKVSMMVTFLGKIHSIRLVVVFDTEISRFVFRVVIQVHFHYMVNLKLCFRIYVYLLIYITENKNMKKKSFNPFYRHFTF